MLMSVTALTGFLATIPPNLWVGALIAGAFLCLKALLDSQAVKKVQRLVNEAQAAKLVHEASEREKDRQHEVLKLAHEASEADKERKHNAREVDKDRKKAVTLALIQAGAREAKLLTLTVA
jgi:hypothetical protein